MCRGTVDEIHALLSHSHLIELTSYTYENYCSNSKIYCDPRYYSGSVTWRNGNILRLRFLMQGLMAKTLFDLASLPACIMAIF